MGASVKNILPFLMVLASVWVVFGFLRPKYDSIQALRAERKEYEQALANASEARARRGHLLEAYSKFSPEQWERLRKMLPAEAGGVQLARDITGIAAIFNIKLDSISFNEAAASSVAVESVQPPMDVAVDQGGGPGPGMYMMQPASVLSEHTLEHSMSFQTDYANFLRFLRELERSLGLMDVTSLSISRGGGGGGGEEEGELGVGTQEYQFELTVNTYWVN